MPITARFSIYQEMRMLAYVLSCVKRRVPQRSRKQSKNCLTKISSAKTFCIGKKVQGAKPTTFRRCINLKPHTTKIHLLKLTVSYTFFLVLPGLHSKTIFFHSRSTLFIIGSGCTVSHLNCQKVSACSSRLSWEISGNVQYPPPPSWLGKLIAINDVRPWDSQSTPEWSRRQASYAAVGELSKPFGTPLWGRVKAWASEWLVSYTMLL